MESLSDENRLLAKQLITQITTLSATKSKDFDGSLDASRNHNPQDLFAIAKFSLQAFIQHNWTGPPLDNDLLQSLNLSAPGNESLIIPLLSVDGEDVYSLTQLPELLLLARHLLESLRKTLENTDDLCDFNLWQSRALFTQQQLLDNPSDTLYAQLTRALEMHEFKLSCDATGESRRTHMAEYHLFHGLVENYYQQNSRAKRHFELAQSATGLQWEMTGALGRRTKFQDFDVAQLTLNAKSNCSEDPVVNASSAAIPKSLALNDDTLLEQIEFNNASATACGVSDSNGRLAVIDQCILLGFCLNVRNTNPAHGLTSEQMMPFVTRVIEQPSNWLVHTMALLLRSRLESTRSRTVERSVFQLQALVDQFSLTDQAEGGAGVDERMQYYWLLALPSRWSMERELGERWMGVGMAKSAREIFERLQMWDQVIACYQISDEDEKAEKIVRRELEKCEWRNPKLLCILGDLTRDPKYWHQAWTANGEDKHYARAMRSLGAWHYKRGEFAECVECYEKALAINALFENSWFTLGCAAMQLQNWPVAQKAFTRCVSLEPENGEAWNNLAAVNLQVDRKRDAMRCLREGLKDKRENWKMWENFTYIALDLGEFSDALLGTERLLALRWHKDPTTIDYEVLRALTDGIAGLSGAIVSELASAANEYRPLRMLSDRLGELLREIVVDYACGKPEAWRLFAHYHKSNNNQKDYLTALQSAYRAFQQSSAADQIQFDGAIFKECAELLAKLVDAYLDGDVKGVCTDGRFQARLILRSFLKRTKENFGDEPEFTELDTLMLTLNK